MAGQLSKGSSVGPRPRTKPGPGSDPGKLPTNTGTPLIDRASTGFRIQENAVAVGFLGQHEQIRSCPVRHNQPFSNESLRHFLERTLGLVFADESQAHQIFELHFDRHRATARPTRGTKSLAVGSPSGWSIDVDLGHAQSVSIDLDQKPAPTSADDGPWP